MFAFELNSRKMNITSVSGLDGKQADTFEHLCFNPTSSISRVNRPQGRMIPRFIHTRLKTTCFVIQYADNGIAAPLSLDENSVIVDSHIYNHRILDILDLYFTRVRLN